MDEIESIRWNTACHEAGHAVVGHLLGREVVSVSITSIDGCGEVKFSPLSNFDVLDIATVIWAGDAGSALSGVERPEVELGGDIIQFELLIQDVLSSGEDSIQFRRAARQRAVELIESHRAQFDEVAGTLFRVGKIEGAEFMQMMVATAIHPTDSDLR